MVLNDCRIPGNCLLGGKEKLDERLAREGKSSKVQAAMSTFEASRPLVGAQALGIARAAYEFALDYSKERIAFGRPIIENQAIAFKLADMKTEIDCAPLGASSVLDGGNWQAIHRWRRVDVEAQGRRSRREGD